MSIGIWKVSKKLKPILKWQVTSSCKSNYKLYFSLKISTLKRAFHFLFLEIKVARRASFHWHLQDYCWVQTSAENLQRFSRKMSCLSPMRMTWIERIEYLNTSPPFQNPIYIFEYILIKKFNDGNIRVRHDLSELKRLWRIFNIFKPLE